jgi:hypothetical protein
MELESLAADGTSKYNPLSNRYLSPGSDLH